MTRKGNPLGYRKGNAVLDTLVVLVVIIVFAITSFFAYQIFGDTKELIEDDVNMSMTEVNETLQGTYDRYPSVLDGLIIFLFIGLWALVIVSSLMIDAHPLFFIFMAVLMLAVIVVAVFMGNFYEELFTDPDISSLPNSFPMTHWVLTNMLWLALGIGFSVGLVLYGKSKYG